MSNNANSVVHDTLQAGHIVTTTVIAADERYVTVRLPNGVEGVIPASELSVLRVKNAAEYVEIGQELAAVVEAVNEKEGTVQLSKRKADARGVWERLKHAMESGETIDVVIRDVVKGGLVTDVGVRGFIPASLVDVEFVPDLNIYKGLSVTVKIAELDETNNRLILSRKAALNEQIKQLNADKISNLQPGEVVEGVVQRLANFGVFVEFDGITGLVHVSELSWDRVERPSDAVQVGDTVAVKILKVDPVSGKVSLSIKAAQENPWSKVERDITVGEKISGKVTRITDFGAFVELKPGVEGLVHVSQISNHHVAKASDVLHIGDMVTVRILSVDSNKGRISLSMREEEDSARVQKPQSKRAEPKSAQQYFVDQSNHGGTGATLGDLFGDLFKK